MTTKSKRSRADKFFFQSGRFSLVSLNCVTGKGVPQNSDAIPALSGERAAIAARNSEEMARFVDQPEVVSDMAAVSSARWDTGKVQTIRSSRRA